MFTTLMLLLIVTVFAYVATVSIRMIVGGETAQRTLAFMIGPKRYRSRQTKGTIAKDSQLRFTGAGMLALLLLFLWAVVSSFVHAHHSG